MVEDTPRVQAWVAEGVAAQSQLLPNLVAPRTRVVHGSTELGSPAVHVQAWGFEVDNRNFRYSGNPCHSFR